jgi:[acyl-carrier-protein] S-malonyltransferase
MIAFVFPGQGSQTVGMGRALAEAYPAARQVFAEADEALGEPFSRLVWEGPPEALMLTENAQPAILTASLAAFRALESEGLASQIDFMAGHSLGEYSAHVAAGTLSFADAVRIVRRRGRYMQEAVPVGTGAMAAIVGLEADRVAEACHDVADGEVVSPANYNGAGQVVSAGARAAVERAARARKRWRETRHPACGAPFHCALMKPAEDRLAPELRALHVREPQVPVGRTSTRRRRRWRGRDRGAGASDLVGGAVEDSVRRLASDGVTAYVEVGPGTVLSGLIRKIHRDAGVVAPSVRRRMWTPQGTSSSAHA